MEHHRQTDEPHRGILARQACVRKVPPQLRGRLGHRGRNPGLDALLAPLDVLKLDQETVTQVGIPGDERLQADVRVALAELRFGPEHEVVGHAQIGGQESLDDLLAAHVVAHPGLRGDGVAQERDDRLPDALVGHPAQQAVEREQIDREHLHVAVGVAQIPVQQTPDRLVGNAEPGYPADHLPDAQQAEVVQQREEVLGLVQPFQGKAGLDQALHGFLTDDLPQQVEVAVQLPADHQQMAQLAVVDADVDVDQIVRNRPVRHGLVQVVEHHVRVVDVRLGAAAEPVAVVPLPHHPHSRVDVLREHAVVPVRAQQTQHFRFGEAEQLVENRMQAEVARYVEAAGDVVERDGRDAGDEQALQAAPLRCPALQGGEEVPIEPAPVREDAVRGLAAMRQDGVGEVVVLVDEHVQRDAPLAGIGEQLIELAVDGRGRQDAPPRRFGKQVPIPLQRVVEHRVAVGLEALPQGLGRVVEHREVEAQDDVAVAVVRGPTPDVGPAEQRLELAGAGAVVVVLQHRHPARLAEAARPDEKDVALLLQASEEPRLVHIEAALQPDGSEIGPAVGNAGIVGHPASRPRSCPPARSARSAFPAPAASAAAAPADRAGRPSNRLSAAAPGAARPSSPSSGGRSP